jgi:hypothetical protein
VDTPGERDLAKVIKSEGHDKDGHHKDKLRKRPNGDDAMSTLASGSTSDLSGPKKLGDGGTGFLGGGMTGTNLGGITGLTGGSGTGSLGDISRTSSSIIKDRLKR